MIQTVWQLWKQNGAYVDAYNDCCDSSNSDRNLVDIGSDFLLLLKCNKWTFIPFDYLVNHDRAWNCQCFNDGLAAQMLDWSAPDKIQ